MTSNQLAPLSQTVEHPEQKPAGRERGHDTWGTFWYQSRQNTLELHCFIMTMVGTINMLYNVMIL